MRIQKKFKWALLLTIISLCLFSVVMYAATTNNYTIDNFTVTGIKSGTAPFNTGSGVPTPGADYSDTDNYIRSYDDMTFNLTPYVSNVPVGTRIKITATINGLSSDYNGSTYYKWGWDTNSVGGAANNATVSSDKKTLTYYKTVQDSGFVSDAPILHIYGGQQGDKFTVTFTAQVENSTVEAKTFTSNEYTISSTPILNAKVRPGCVSSATTLNGVNGRLLTFGISLASTYTDLGEFTDSSGNLSYTEKGMGYPVGPIKLKVQILNTIKDHNNNETGEIRALDYNIVDVKANGRTLSDGTNKYSGTTSDAPLGYYSAGWIDQCVSNSGTMYFSESVDATNMFNNPCKEYTVTVKDWTPSQNHVKWMCGEDTSNTPISNLTKYFTGHTFLVFVPFPEDLTDFYSNTRVRISGIEYKDAANNTITIDKNSDDNVATMSSDKFSGGQASIDSDFRGVESSKYLGDGAVSIGQKTTLFTQSFFSKSGYNIKKEEVIVALDGSKFDIDRVVGLRYDWKDTETTAKFGVSSLTTEELTKMNPGDVFTKFDSSDSGVTWYDTLEEAKAACTNTTDKNICYVYAQFHNEMTSSQFAIGGSLTHQVMLNVLPKNTCSTNTVYGFKGSARYTSDTGIVKYTPTGPYDISTYENGEKTGGHSPSVNRGGTSLYILPATVGVQKAAFDPTLPEDNNHITTLYLPKTNELNWSLTYTMAIPDTVNGNDRKVTITDTLPKGLTYVTDSATLEPTSVIVNADGSTTIKWVINNPSPIADGVAVRGNIKYKTTVSNLTASGTGFESSVIIENPLDIRPVAYKMSTYKVTVSNEAGFSMKKLVNKDSIFKNNDLVYELQYSNTTNSPLTNVTMLDVLPKNGKNNSKFSGSYDLVDFYTVSNIKCYYTTDSIDTTINASNIPSSITWKTLTQSNVTDAKNATALKFEIASLEQNTEGSVKIRLRTKGNTTDDIYVNNFTTKADGSDLVTSNSVLTKVLSASITGTIWNDTTTDGLIGDDEPILANRKVYLYKDDKQITSTITDDKGQYEFKDLELGNYKVVFDVPGDLKLTINGDTTNTKASHAITSQVGGKNVASTSKIELSEANPTQVLNAGLINGLTLEKTGDLQVVQKGSIVTYSIKLTNTSTLASDGSKTAITDIIPKGVEVVAGSISDNGTLSNGNVVWNVTIPDGGKSKIVTVKMKVTGNVTKIRNLANLPGVKPVGPPETPVITFEKSANPISGSDIKEGDEITYTIKINNSSDVEAKDIKISDVIPEGTTYVEGSADANGSITDKTLNWTISSLAANSSQTVSFKVKADSIGDSVSKDIQNVAKINGSDTNIVKHRVVKSKLEIIKAVDKVIASEDDLITYTFNVKNVGTTSTTADFEDTLPEGLSDIKVIDQDGLSATDNKVIGNLGTIKPNETVTFKIQAKVNTLAQDSYEATLNNKASIKDDTSAEIIESNEVTTKVLKGELYFEKSANVEDMKNVFPGDEITYSIKVGNKGTKAIENVIVKDKVPENTTLVDAMEGKENEGEITWNLPSVDAGKEVTVSFKVKVNNDIDNVDIINIATVNDIETNKVTNPVRVSKPSIKLETSTDKVMHVGDEYFYTITVENTGSGDLTPAVVTNIVPKGVEVVTDSISDNGVLKDNIITWDLGTLKAGESKKFTYSVRIKDFEGTEKLIPNIARLNEINSNEVENKAIKESPSPVQETLPKTGALNSNNVGILLIGLTTVLLFVFTYKKFRRRS